MNSQARFKIPRQDIGPHEPWRVSLANNAQLIATILEREPTTRDGADLLEAYSERVALASVFPDEKSERDTATSLAASSAHAAAIAQARHEGWIELQRDGAALRRFPCGTSALTPGLWIIGWSLALTARDHAALKALCDEQTIDACRPPDGRGDSFWPTLFSALATLVFDASEFPARAVEARRALTSAEPRIVESGYIEHLLLPLLSLGEQLVAGDAAGWDEALAGALTQHATWYADEKRRFDRSSFLAFSLLGVAALANDRGIMTHVESEYLPLDLVTGQFARVPSEAIYVYPTHKLSRPDEARWFLDLEGFPRSRRKHFVTEVEGRLVARYIVEGAPGIPKARADFVLAPTSNEEREVDGSFDYALDVGSLVLIADWFAKRAGEASLPESERRASLSEAVDALDAAIERIPKEAQRAPETSFWSERGRAAFEREPSRFSRDRLQAYADSLRARLNEGDTQTSESLSKANAAAAIELICAEVTPILSALARDTTGTLANELAPRDEDYERVFVGEAVEIARRAYHDIWSQGIRIQYPTSLQTEIRCYAAPAGMLGEENELSRRFPGGYQAIARWLNPHRVWIAWKCVRPGEQAGISYDGLVWIDDHWAWFPKPYRILKKAMSL